MSSIVKNNYTLIHLYTSLNVIFFPYIKIVILKILPHNFNINQQKNTIKVVVYTISFISTVPIPILMIIINGVKGGIYDATTVKKEPGFEIK